MINVNYIIDLGLLVLWLHSPFRTHVKIIGDATTAETSYSSKVKTGCDFLRQYKQHNKAKSS